jgi:hypothetical protein
MVNLQLAVSAVLDTLTIQCFFAKRSALLVVSLRGWLMGQPEMGLPQSATR